MHAEIMSTNQPYSKTQHCDLLSGAVYKFSCLLTATRNDEPARFWHLV